MLRYVRHELENTKACQLSFHPDSHKFCSFLLGLCQDLGVSILLGATVTDLSSSSPIATILQHNIQFPLPCHNLVIAAGPWSQRVLDNLFPFSNLHLGMNTFSTSGNHLGIRTPRWKPEDDEKNCLYLNMNATEGRFDVTSELGGTLYVCGPAKPEALPSLSTQVSPQPESIRDMLNICKRILDIPEGEAIEVLEEGRCYRPIMKRGFPVITEVLVDRLGSKAEGMRVFLNTGHGKFGLSQGLGSGKVCSELIRGVDLSVDIGQLGLDGL